MPFALCMRVVFSSSIFAVCLFVYFFFFYAIINFNNIKSHIHKSNVNGKIRFQFGGFESNVKEREVRVTIVRKGERETN